MKINFAHAWNLLSWQAKGACLLLVHMAKDSYDIPESAEMLQGILGAQSKRVWTEIQPWVTDMKIMADANRSLSHKRKEAAKARWAEQPAKPEKKTAPPKAAPVRKLRLEILKGDSVECFNRLWAEWPKRTDGTPARGEKAKAEKLFQMIVDAGVANAWELEESAKAYRHYPNVERGYVKMVQTFFATEDGMWRECLERVRKGPRAKELALKTS